MSPTLFKHLGAAVGDVTYIQRTRKLSWHRSAAGSGCLLESPRCLTSNKGMKCPLAKTLGEKRGGVVLQVSDVRKPGKEVASDGTVRRELHGVYGRVFSRMSARADQFGY